MTNKFFTNFNSPDGSDLELYLEEPKEGTPSAAVPPFLKKLTHPAESADWAFVEGHISQTMSMKISEGWIKTWGIGKPIPSLPQELDAESLVFSAVDNELDIATPSETRIAAEFLLALFIIENKIDVDTAPAKGLVLSVNDAGRDNDMRGGFAVTTKQWEDFVASEGVRLNWTGDFLRELILPQMRCAAWLAHRNRKRLGVAFGATPTEPFLGRMLDLFMAHLIGDVATAAVLKLERDSTGINKKIRTVIRDSNSFSDSAPELAFIFENRAEYVGELTATGGGTTTVKGFFEACEAALDPAVKLARRMLDFYLPGFAVTAASADAYMQEAETELGDWDDGWVEQVDPGRTRATEYFEATDYEPDIVIDANNELTHWCGAFVAFCMDKVGAPVPTGSAAAANWRNWGDVSMPATPGSPDIPKGAVVMTSGGDNTNHIGHVCFFVEWLNGGTHFKGLGGNQSDSVTVAEFKTSRIVEIRALADRSQSSGTDVEVLARTLWGEIRNGNDAHVKNVAHVVLNRFLTGYRSDGSIAGACLKHMQFSCWNPGTSARAQIDELPDDNSNAELNRMRQIAGQIIKQRLANPGDTSALEGARHYHNHDVNPNWAIPANEVTNDGLHIFYKNIA